MNTHLISNSNEAALSLTRWLLSNTKAKTVLLASGGSSASVLAEAWKHLDKNTKDSIRITLADERYGEVGHGDSNWQLLQNSGVDLTDQRHVPVLRPGLNMEETAATWERDLAELLNWADAVIAILGVGADAHIAGIKPNSTSAHEHAKLVSAYAWNDYSRITVSPAMFPHIDNAVVYMKGAEKRPVLEQLAEDLDPVVYPDQLIKQVDSFTIYYQS